jgi:hypothetical protein
MTSAVANIGAMNVARREHVLVFSGVVSMYVDPRSGVAMASTMALKPTIGYLRRQYEISG